MVRICNIARIIFCIDRRHLSSYISGAYQEEVGIENFSTRQMGFTRCSNSKCNLVFQTGIEKTFSDADFLCPACKQKLNTFHVVQCSNCQSIVNFLDLDDGEESIVFYVRKCHRCTGTEEDERKLQFFYFPDLML